MVKSSSKTRTAAFSFTSPSSTINERISENGNKGIEKIHILNPADLLPVVSSDKGMKKGKKLREKPKWVEL
jgi:hypothetical protein